MSLIYLAVTTYNVKLSVKMFWDYLFTQIYANTQFSSLLNVYQTPFFSSLKPYFNLYVYTDQSTESTCTESRLRQNETLCLFFE